MVNIFQQVLCPIAFHFYTEKSRLTNITCSTTVKMSTAGNMLTPIPYLQVGQSIVDWGKEFTAACAQLEDVKSLKILPQYAGRDVGTKEYAYIACEDPEKKKTLAAALIELANFVEGKQTRLAKSSKFFNVTLEDTTVEAQTKFFFELVNSGNEATIPSDVIILKFLQAIPGGNKFFDKSKDEVVPGLDKRAMITLFQKWTIRESHDAVQSKFIKEETFVTEENTKLAQLEQDLADIRLKLVQFTGNGDASSSDSESVMFNDSKKRDHKSKRGSQSRKSCSECGKSGHERETCYKRICKRCGGKGHDAEKCPSYAGPKAMKKMNMTRTSTYIHYS